ncbi:selenide, water dikinase SelD [cyanobacterium endosymbiont of Epithemia clementina EcSB]|uniref:selenide, water dikinase SelD n=1 Tax=cyanobacterium endosymbiont of Epithemia clementina EcSB TaxID=3034674 RepID=UPI002480FA26|nr:selenide, water dikinase SelD [cyanobacterium endosymbiont of Epithemia clementina EcSB]WGT68461.1 selenide, water dikinase SelD [cyanobacterium endosymbiont of Epithemia clementina EcSB]
MQSKPIPIIYDLVLIGGGHSHAITLKLWGMNPIPGVRLTLITDTSHTPYSGMLPGHVAGFYSFDETHIDLRRLARFSRAQLYLDQAINLDLINNKVICAKYPPVDFDYLSIDIGSTPETVNIPGASQYAITAKPIPKFLTVWNEIIETVIKKPHQQYSISIVGGGAGGVELALNIHSRLTAILQKFNQPLSNIRINLFHQGETLLTSHNSWVSKRSETILEKRKIQLFLNERVIKITSNNSNSYQIYCDTGLAVDCDFIFWVTQASAPSWIKDCGLKTDNRGFILVNKNLQSISHPNIFAAGDIATIQDTSYPKAGVFAVRQGKPLFKNLQKIILEKPLISYQPQKYFLSLIGTGDKRAIASWGYLGWESSILWHWKDYIDRQFIQQFTNFPSMDKNSLITIDSLDLKTSNLMPCVGCGSKVGKSILEKVLNRLEIRHNKNVLVGLNNPDDAAIIILKNQSLLVQTIDFFPSLINDPFIFGQITAHHCLSDIFAMSATPDSVLAIVTLPYGLEKKLEETLYQLLSGVIKVLNRSQVSLIGGHTIESSELALGLSCNGFIFSNNFFKKSGMNSGDKLILTKGIGTGTLFAADMNYQAKGRWIDNAVESMLLSNQQAAKIFLKFEATACTDVTGFGLLGHLVEMIKASKISVSLDLENIVVLEGAIQTTKQGITSSLYPQNLQASNYILNLEEVKHKNKFPLLFDPQTSGGLLASIPSDKADKCLLNLIRSGFKDSCIIGQVLEENLTEPFIIIN